MTNAKCFFCGKQGSKSHFLPLVINGQFELSCKGHHGVLGEIRQQIASGLMPKLADNGNPLFKKLFEDVKGATE